MAEDSYDLIIAGGGPAGLSAGIYAKRAALNTVLIEKSVVGGQVAITKGVENYPGFIEIEGFDLCNKFLEHAKSYDLEIVNKKIEAIEPDIEHHRVRLADGTLLKANAVIIATGGTARKLEVEGEEENFGKGVSYCATCDGFFFRGKTVAVVGGGDTALEDALYLAKITSKVYLIHRRDEFRGSRILQQRVFADPNIEIIFDTVVRSIDSDDDGVKGLSLENVKKGKLSALEVEGVFIFVGFSPNNGLVPAGIKKKNHAVRLDLIH